MMNIYGKRIRIANKTRFTIALLILLLAILCVFNIAFHTVSGNENIIYKDYLVTKGETIWSIADIASSDQIDIREMVYHISKVNNINGSDHIYPGQVLKIPIGENQTFNTMP